MVFRSLTVFAYDCDDILKEIAKKNSETDLTIYSRKNEDLITTFISPSRYPDKISSLTDSLFPAHIALVHIKEINRDVAEMLIALSLRKIRHTVILIDDTVDREFLQRVLKDANIGSHEFSDLSGIELAEKIESFYQKGEQEKTEVVVDQFFKVKSVGVVILGFVISGSVKKHQELTATYSDKKVMVKSIQMQDIEVEEAPEGSRVGLALKNIDVDQLERGVILTDSDIEYFNESEGNITMHPSIRKKFPESFEVFVSDCMRYQRGTISSGTLKLDRKFVDLKKNILLTNPNSAPRVIGVFRPSDH